MRRSVLMMLLAAMSQGAAAEWVDAGHNGDFTAYTDPATIRRSGNRVRMLSLIDHKAAMTKSGKAYISVKAQHEFDCKEGQARILFSSLHSGNMGKDKIVWSSYSSDNFEPILPSSILETLWKVACEQR